MGDSVAVPYGDTFVLVGGHGDDGERIYKFVPETEGWEVVPGRLDYPRSYVTAMFVDPESFPNC